MMQVLGTAEVWMPVDKNVSPASNSHEWLIRRENVELCGWLVDFIIRIVCPIRRDARLGWTAPLDRPLTHAVLIQISAILLL